MAERERYAVVALVLITLITVGWWALALWPFPSDAPTWLARARYVCFGSAETGLPDGAGWMALTLQPLIMYGAAVGIWGRSIPIGLRQVWANGAGRVSLMGTVLALALGVSAATVRVVDAASRTGPGAFEVSDVVLPDTYPRFDKVAPRIGLIDQHGASLDMDRFTGEFTLVTFAFAQCSTICPLFVRDVMRAQRALDAEGIPTNVVVITLDPWRDLPSRLPAIADKWMLADDAYVVTGDIESVHAVLEAWNVPWRRDERTGDITHPRLFYIVDGQGTIAYSASGSVAQMTELARRAIRP